MNLNIEKEMQESNLNLNKNNAYFEDDSRIIKNK